MCELCDEQPEPHGFYIYLRVSGAWRLYRVCEDCYLAYQSSVE